MQLCNLCRSRLKGKYRICSIISSFIKIEVRYLHISSCWLNGRCYFHNIKCLKQLVIHIYFRYLIQKLIRHPSFTSIIVLSSFVVIDLKNIKTFLYLYLLAYNILLYFVASVGTYMRIDGTHYSLCYSFRTSTEI